MPLNDHLDNIKLFKKWIWRILIVCSALELIFFPDVANLFGCAVFMYGWLLVDNFVLKRKYFNSCFVLPVLAVFGLAFTYYFLALPVTLIEGKPLTFNFEVPYLTWFNQILFITSIVIAFKLCSLFYKPDCWLNSFWAKAGFFKIPSDTQVWILGIMGVFALIVRIIIQGDNFESAKQQLGFSMQILQFIEIYSVFPIFFLLPSLYNRRTINKRKNILLWCYIGVLMIVGVATTRRAIMFRPIIALAFGYFVYVLLYNKRLFNRRNTILLIVGLYLLIGPVADIAVAMIVNRHVSYTQSASKTFEDVLELYKDKELLHDLYQYSLMENDNRGRNQEGWSEYYVDNIFLDRFCNIRVIDATLFHAQKLGYERSISMNQYYKDFWIYQTPSFLLAKGVKKKDISSPGDMLSGDGLRLDKNFVGYRVAGDTGVGLSLWGYKFYIINTLVMFIVFFFLSSLVKVIKSGSTIQFPLLILAEIMNYFRYYDNANGIFNSFRIILRDGWEQILLYCLILFFVSKIKFSKP